MKHHVHIALTAIAMLLGASAHADGPGALDEAARYRKLDRLQALGFGMLNQQAPKPPEPADAHGASAPFSQQRITDGELRRRSIAQNAKSAAALTEALNRIKADCGGQLLEWPEVGMSDDVFRRCTLHARFGNIAQLVVSEDRDTPLRLYVFPSERAHKVYTIGGVVTAIRP